jgi:hypothetical protein
MQPQLGMRRTVSRWPECTRSKWFFSPWISLCSLYRNRCSSPKKRLLNWHKWTTFDMNVTSNCWYKLWYFHKELLFNWHKGITFDISVKATVEINDLSTSGHITIGGISLLPRGKKVQYRLRTVKKSELLTESSLTGHSEIQVAEKNSKTEIKRSNELYS